MERSDRDKIQRNLVPLSKLVNVSQVAELLIGRGVIDHEFLERIQIHPTTFQKNQEFFLMYTKRGPKAFSFLVQALMETGHISEARLLDEEQVFIRGGQGGGQGLTPPTARSTRGRIGSLESPESENSLSISNSSSENSGREAGGGGGGVQPIFESPEFSSGPSSSSSGGGSGSGRKDPKKSLSASKPSNISPTSALRQLNLRLEGEEENGGIGETPPASPSPINRTPIPPAKNYNQGKLSEEEAYPMMSYPRGYALIINNINFPSDPEDVRTGAEHDSENLRLLFEELGFITTVRVDQRKRDITHPTEGILVKFRDQFVSHPPVDAAILAIMSHGMEESKIRTSDPGHTYIDLYEDVIKPFNNFHCPSLLGKPKLFIVQTCRGGTRDRGIRCKSSTDGKNLAMVQPPMSSAVYDEADDFSAPLSHPSFEDILICYPTIPGFVANRDTERGTWYIQCLVEAVRQHAADLEVCAILRKVGLKMRVVNNEWGEKQMCSFKNIGFHRELYFNPGIFADE